MAKVAIKYENIVPSGVFFVMDEFKWVRVARQWTSIRRTGGCIIGLYSISQQAETDIFVVE